MTNTQTNETKQILPEYIQAPAHGKRCKITSMSRSTFLSFCKRENVKSKFIRSNPHSIRGIRLFSVSSILARLEAQPSE